MADLHPIRKDLLSFLTILEKLIRKLLTSACEKCVVKQKPKLLPEQSYLSAVLRKDSSILYKRAIVYQSEKDMKKMKTCNAGNEKRLMIPNTSTVLPNPDINEFDVTLSINLLKNISENECFSKKELCATSCTDCDLKEAVETVRIIRNIAMHGTYKEFEDFFTKNQQLSGLESYKSWNDLKDQIGKTFQLLLTYTRDKGNYPKSGNVTSDEETEIMKLEMKMIKVLPAEKKEIHFYSMICKMVQNLSLDEEEKNKAKAEELSNAMISMTKTVENLYSAFSGLINTINQRSTEIQSVEFNPKPINSKASLGNMNINQWINDCQRLYKQVYKTGVNFYDYINPKNFIEHTLNTWFNKNVRRRSAPYWYALISSYSAKAHQSFENGQSAFEELLKSSKDYILLLSYIDWCVYYMRITEAISENDIKDELESLNNEIECWEKLHNETFSKEKVLIYRTLILSNVTRKSLDSMSEIDEISFKIISNDDWTSISDIEEWLKNLNASNIRLKSNNDVFMNILSRILGFYSILYKDQVPHIHDNHYQLIEKIPLTEDQKDVINTKELKHVIFTGSYGTGKTLVLQKKLFKLVSESTHQITIYYILGDTVGLLYAHTKNILQDYRHTLTKNGKKVNVKNCKNVFASLYAVPSTEEERADVTFCLMSFEEIEHFSSNSSDISVIIENIIRDINTHIFIDEYNAENLTSTVACKLRELIKTKLNESVLYLIPKPLKVRRTSNETTGDKLKGFCFEDTGMNRVCFYKAFRNPKNIFELFQVAQNVIQEFSTEYKFKRGKMEGKSDIVKEEDMKIEAIKNENKVDSEADIKEQTNIDTSLQNTLPVESTFQQTHNSSDEILDKFTNTYDIDNTSTCAHAITGDLPICYIPFDIDCTSLDEISNQALYHLKLALDEAKANRKRSVIICSTIYQSKLCVRALDESSKIKVYLPSLKRCNQRDVLNLYNDLRDSILITDFIGVRGMELENVVVILSTDDYFLAPFFLESFTRAVNQLSLIFLNLGYKDPHESITSRLRDKWNEKNLIQNKFISCTRRKILHDTKTDDEIVECLGGIKDHESYFGSKEECDGKNVFSHSDPFKLLLYSFGLAENTRTPKVTTPKTDSDRTGDVYSRLYGKSKTKTDSTTPQRKSDSLKSANGTTPKTTKTKTDTPKSASKLETPKSRTTSTKTKPDKGTTPTSAEGVRPRGGVFDRYFSQGTTIRRASSARDAAGGKKASTATQVNAQPSK